MRRKGADLVTCAGPGGPAGDRRCGRAAGRGPGSALGPHRAADALQVDVAAGGEEGRRARRAGRSADDRLQSPHLFPTRSLGFPDRVSIHVRHPSRGRPPGEYGPAAEYTSGRGDGTAGAPRPVAGLGRREDCRAPGPCRARPAAHGGSGTARRDATDLVRAGARPHPGRRPGPASGPEGGPRQATGSPVGAVAAGGRAVAARSGQRTSAHWRGLWVAANSSAAARSKSPWSLPSPCATSAAAALPRTAASPGMRPRLTPRR